MVGQTSLVCGLPCMRYNFEKYQVKTSLDIQIRSRQCPRKLEGVYRGYLGIKREQKIPWTDTLRTAQ